jgi:thiamine biosynthesis lipoprotein
MGTVFAVEADIGHDVVDELFDWWRTVESRFSTFRDDSEITRIARDTLDLDDAHPDVRHVLSTCAELESATGGRFTIRSPRPGGPSLDPAGYVKGWSVDEAALVLRARGVDDFMIYAGGDVLCGGSPPDADRWQVGVRDPIDHDRVIATLALERGAVATSGAYERGDHIWGEPAGLRSVTVVGPSLGIADALATAVFAAGVDDDRSWLDSFEGYEVLLVRDDRARITGDISLGAFIEGS